VYSSTRASQGDRLTTKGKTMLENNNETATATALLTHNELLMNENAVLKAEVARLDNAFEFVAANLKSWSKRWNDMSDYIQASINNEEWTEDELAEPFWEHLATEFNLDLKQTEEVEVTFTVTYTATLTLPKDADLDDLELEIESYPDVTYRSENVGEARESDSEVSRTY
jgi:hypothetical protein